MCKKLQINLKSKKKDSAVNTKERSSNSQIILKSFK